MDGQEVWRKSSKCTCGECVEIASDDREASGRDTKTPDPSALMFTPAAWRAFIDGMRDGQFDLARVILGLSGLLIVARLVEAITRVVGG